MKPACVGVAMMMFVPMLAPAQAPLVDHHQHMFSPPNAEWSSTPSSPRQSVGAADIIALLDSAGIRRALVLSVAYQFGNPTRSVENEYEKVKAENDWTSAQVALYPDRLRAFCGVNPTRDYALQEIARCARDPHLRSGLKLHFGNSDVDLHDPHQLAQLKRVFRAANDNRMAIVVHMHGSVNKKRPYGRAEAEIFLNDLLTSVPDVPVQIAHFAGAGTYDDSTDHAIAVFAEAIEKRDPRTAHVYFDASLSGLRDMPEERKEAHRCAYSANRRRSHPVRIRRPFPRQRAPSVLGGIPNASPLRRGTAYDREQCRAVHALRAGPPS